MKKIINPFVDIYPSVDLHGLDRDAAVLYTKEFINDNLKLGKEKIVIVHGRGEGVLRTSVHEYLKNNKDVIEYKTDNFNDGVTIVTLKNKI